MPGRERIEARQLLLGSGDPVLDGVVVLADGVVAYAGPASAAPATPDASVTSCDTALPGLWDCHVHTIGQQTMALSRIVTDPIARQMVRAVRDVGAALRMGFTSVREVGGLGVHLEHVRREGLVRSPAIYSSNAILSPTGGHADIHDLPLDLMERFGQDGMLALCDGVPEALKTVRRQLRVDAKLIKVCASGGVLSEVDHPIHQQFGLDELRAIVEEAARAERIVAAHCHGAPGIEAAIEAGVHTIEHGSYLTPDLAAGMVERGMVLVPTLTIVDALVNGDGGAGASERSLAKGRAIHLRHLEAVEIALAAGVTIALGTDIGPSLPGHPAGWGRNARELELLVGVGMTPLQTIEAATSVAPTTLGPQAPRSGRLEAGFDGDVLALSADPLADIATLQDPSSIAGVWQAGERVVVSRDGVPELLPLPLL